MRYVIIQPYFGKFPIWIDLFIYSCGKNPKVDFVFFTDCEISKSIDIYKNVKFIKTNFEEYCDFVSERLNIDFHPDNTYKLCDLKPFLGVVHFDIISQYDCWGYCDIDLVLGDLSILLSKMEKFDLISTHSDRCSGHFTLIKTKSKYTKLCFKIWRWKIKLMSRDNKCLDEDDLTGVVSWFLRYRVPIFNRIIKPLLGMSKYTYFKLSDYALSVLQSKRVSFEEYFTTPMPDFKSEFIFESTSGKIFDKVRDIELPYLHFLFFKKTQYSDNKDYWKDGFYRICHQHLVEGKKIKINKICIDCVPSIRYCK